MYFFFYKMAYSFMTEKLEEFVHRILMLSNDLVKEITSLLNGNQSGKFGRMAELMYRHGHKKNSTNFSHITCILCYEMNKFG